MLVVIVAGAGLAAAAAIAVLARRWPTIEAPRVSTGTIADEVRAHPRVAGGLRRHFDPSKETGVALTAAAIVVVVSAVAVGILAVTVRSKFGLSSIDVRVARFAAANATDASTTVMKWLSQFGGTPGVLAIAVGVTLYELGRRPSAALPGFMALVVGGQFVLSNTIKVVVERARPDFDRLTGFAGSSFPSGHSTAAAATLAAVALITTRGRSARGKEIAASAAAGLTVMVAGSRIFLGVHWFSDTIGGVLLGWGWFALCSIAFGGRLLTFGVPVVEAERVADSEPPTSPGSSSGGCEIRSGGAGGGGSAN